MTRFLLGAMFAAFAIGASGQGAWNDIPADTRAALDAKGDPARGETAFGPCVGCHRRDASGRTSGAYPRLSGQHRTVLIKQIGDIRSGRRTNPKMEPYLVDHAMSPFEVADIATFLSGLPISAENGKGPGKGLDEAKKIYDRDCANCHGAAGEGNAAQFYPMVAAQHFRYLQREMQFIRDGDRRNAHPDMVKVVKPLSGAEAEAIADYMSRLPPPAR